jgi:[ribosomal protein S18]-alanine N-acetyltransferase
MPESVSQIRVLQESDLPAVMAIETRAYEFPWTEQIFRDCFRSGYSGIALWQEQQLLGYGMLSSAVGEAHLLNVAVDPALQSQGLGKRLVLRLIDLARWHRAERLFLEVRRSNVRAMRLYARLGFNEIGERKSYYPGRKTREDAIVMAMELSLGQVADRHPGQENSGQENPDQTQANAS